MINFEKEYWNNRYATGGNSGYGSYNEQLEKKLSWLKGLDIESISEIGCGDLNFAKALMHEYKDKLVTYSGQDISEVVIEGNRGEIGTSSFTTDIDELPKSDLLLCIDVLFHVLDDREYEELLDKIENKWTKNLAITAYEHDNNENLAPHVKIRKFDYKRFGEPIIREIVEEDGSLYFYLFKRQPRASQLTTVSASGTGPMQESIQIGNTSCCLITKESEYPKEILNEIKKFSFGEILILVNSDSPYNKHKLFQAARFENIYYQDDDAIVPIADLFRQSMPDIINVGMKQGHFEAYKNTRMTMGLGWGGIFPKKMLQTLSKYTDKYGEDDVYRRETERIFTYLNFPQNRIILPIQDLPSAWAEDRLWRQPIHNEYAKIVEERCRSLVL